MSAESGVQLLARLVKRPSIAQLDNDLFAEGVDPGNKILIHGEPSAGKSMLLNCLIARCILPKHLGGLEVEVVIIQTAHNDNIHQFSSMLKEMITLKEAVAGSSLDAILHQALKRLIVFSAYCCDDLLISFFSIDKMLSLNYKIGLVAVDTISEFYWQDVVKVGASLRMDRYIHKIVEQLDRVASKHKILIILTRQGVNDLIQLTKSFLLHFMNDHPVNFRRWYYDDVCGSAAKFDELVEKIKETNPEVSVNGFLGRQGSFEVSINGEHVYSKLATLAYPDLNAVSKVVDEVARGQMPRKIEEQQPITDCVVM